MPLRLKFVSVAFKERFMHGAREACGGGARRVLVHAFWLLIPGVLFNLSVISSCAMSLMGSTVQALRLFSFHDGCEHTLIIGGCRDHVE